MSRITLGLFLFSFLFVACDRKDSARPPGQGSGQSNQNENYVPPYHVPSYPIISNKCLQIFYDNSSDANYWLGEAYANMVSSLASHFPGIPHFMRPIESYQAYDVYHCQYNIYLGSYFDNKIPESFLTDFAYAPTRIFWVGTNIWQLGKAFPNIFGFSYSKTSELNHWILDRQNRPTFFRYFHYRGEIFEKYGEYNSKHEFQAPYDMVELKQSHAFPANVLSWSQHNGNGDYRPYALSIRNRYYLADVPFSFIHENDRYLIFSDLLFDFLQQSPVRSQKLAFVRLEEVDPNFVPVGISKALQFLSQINIKPHIPIVPTIDDPARSAVAMKKLHEEIQMFDPYYIWVGVKPESRPDANFSFWDIKNNTPLPEDSVDFVLTRLEKGYEVFKLANIQPQIWMTPFNSASALDSSIFARIFPWRIGRTVNFNHTQFNLPNTSQDLGFNTGDANENLIRRQAFQNAQVNANLKSWAGQFFPYEVYADLYEHKIIPENMGALKLSANGSGATPQQMLENAKRLSVVRDSWASFYVSINELASPEGQNQFRNLYQKMTLMGYQFISLSQDKHVQKIQKQGSNIGIKKSTDSRLHK